MAATLELRRLSKRYEAAHALQEVSFVANEGEFVVVVGPSGCGKSTLLRVVAGLDEISSGEVVLNGRVVNTIEPKDRDIAMVFQNYALYPHMSVEGNMAYGLRMRGVTKPEIAKRVRDVAQLLELTPLLKRMPRELSGGQRQRVAIGRAIVRQPSLFLFDEPLSNLDARLRAQMRLELRKLHRRLGVTSIYVTHDQTEAMTLGERIVVMIEGRIQQIGSPTEIYERPASVFVASFIGSPPMNLFKATFAANGEWMTFSGKVDLRLAQARPNLAGAPVVLGLRPEHLRCGSRDEHALPVTIDTIETLGFEQLVYGDVDGQPVVLRVPSHEVFRPGETTWAHFAPESVHYFNASTGQRLNTALTC
ncbi:MAG TPA: sn-glycerol-3-phosphate ABC transporter ATP-binding protein UgpC [Burkholderiaceae bacterium]|nr:sn-glycerol-3-phosphate ABC transporter ATP-binding protein UgpC [Burkholderiaceae bacterium]